MRNMLDRTPILSRFRVAAVVAGIVPFWPTPPLLGQAAPQPSPFPLEVGNSWTYAGTVWWMPRYSRRIFEERVRLEVEVVDLIERDGVRAAIIEGHPHDLISGRGRSPQRYLLIEIGGDRVYLLKGARYYEALHRLRDPSNSLVGLVADPELVLHLPLFEGKRLLCPDARFPGERGLGCWMVRSEEVIDLTSIWGLDGPEKRERYTLDLRHRGEHDVWGFVPGVGFTFYGVGHPGDLSALELDLIEVHLVDPPVRRVQTTVHLGETAIHRIEELVRQDEAPILMQATATAQLPDPIPLEVPVVTMVSEAKSTASRPPSPELPACLDDEREWVRTRATVAYEGHAFEPLGRPEPVSSENLVRVAHHDGVPLYVSELASPPYSDLWLPRCDPQGTYSMYTKSSRASQTEP